ncbi:hypothetical protein RAAC3_TM7C00001G0622 [Candidatus Saccharibacteria bacterium RAAC3_TM7_1]|nr:hypothetical protein RAAC3_TM7C00001G0622 [Candidatus Saccharibacteria bacterium RAAC3_TM7_1]HCZ28383.1 hypothetical protein [Candidatus Saccharibacteria bacterium]
MKKSQKTSRTSQARASKGMMAWVQTERDFKDALLIVSLTINLFILCLWAALQVTTNYDDALVSFFFNR